MKYTYLFLLILLIAPVVFSDAMFPIGERYNDYCYKFEKLDQNYYYFVVQMFGNPFSIEDNNCYKIGYKYNSVKVVAITKSSFSTDDINKFISNHIFFSDNNSLNYELSKNFPSKSFLISNEEIYPISTSSFLDTSTTISQSFTISISDSNLSLILSKTEYSFDPQIYLMGFCFNSVFIIVFVLAVLSVVTFIYIFITNINSVKK